AQQRGLSRLPGAVDTGAVRRRCRSLLRFLRIKAQAVLFALYQPAPIAPVGAADALGIPLGFDKALLVVAVVVAYRGAAEAGLAVDIAQAVAATAGRLQRVDGGEAEGIGDGDLAPAAVGRGRAVVDADLLGAVAVLAEDGSTSIVVSPGRVAGTAGVVEAGQRGGVARVVAVVAARRG